MLTGCFNGQVQILTLQGASNGYNRVKEFEVDAEPNSVNNQTIMKC